MKKWQGRAFILTVLFAFGVLTSVSQASVIHGEEIYEWEGVYVSVMPAPPLTKSFEIPTAGNYIAEFEYEIDEFEHGHHSHSSEDSSAVLGLSLSNSAGTVLGNSIGIGSFTFTADAGTHTLKIFGLPGELFTMGHFEVEITAVPVPAAFILFGSALVALFGTAKRRRMTASKQYNGLVAA